MIAMPTLRGPAPLRFTVPGKPQPAGSKRAFKRGARVIVVDDNTKAKPWQAEVKAAAIEAMRGAEVLAGPIKLEVCFHMARPKAHYGAGGRVKASAPLYPIVRPDTTKLLRGLEDALTGTVWRDDAQVVDQLAQRLYTGDGSTFTVVSITPLDERGTA